MDVKTKIAMLPNIGAKPKLLDDVLNDLAEHESLEYTRESIDEAITAALNPDTTVISGSNALVTSNAVYVHVGDRIVDNLTSTDTKNALSANQGRILNERLSLLEAVGRFLAFWDCSTGKPAIDPVVVPYTYKIGDYYRVSVIGSVNYMPTGKKYTGEASEVICEDAVAVGDTFYFTGLIWQLQKGGQTDGVRDVLTYNGLSLVDSGIARLPQYSTVGQIDDKLNDEVERADNKYGTKEELNTKINENDAIEIITDRLASDADIDELFK